MAEKSIIKRTIKFLYYNFRRPQIKSKRDIDELDDIQTFKDQVKTLKPDAVFVQGCSIELLTHIIQEIRSLNVGLAYNHIQSDDILKQDTQFCMLTSLTMIKKSFIRFEQTLYDRGIIKYVIDTKETINQKPKLLTILTAELEPSTGIVQRRHQIDTLKNITIGDKTPKNQPVIFFGCTNIPNWQNTVIQPQDWLDAWRETGNSDSEYTNGMDRMDRIWYWGVDCVKYSTIPINLPKRYFAILTEFSIC